MKKTTKKVLSLILVMALCISVLLPVYASNPGEAEAKAAALKQLGLFKGVSDTDFALDRAATRTEAFVMLIRALGKESEALGGSWAHPFTDVPSWADKYIGYGYEKGLTKGVSATQFGTGNADLNMYLTFILRALGYSDIDGDFLWNAPETLARAAGILPGSVDTSNFLRADVAIVSWAALEADLKGGSQSLSGKLIDEGVFTAEAYTQAAAQTGETGPDPVSVSSLEELSSALSDSSVKAITIDSIGTPLIITGEVTIPRGVTVTVSCGNDFYIEGTLVNNGVINVMGADSITADFINYSVLCVQAGGVLQNNGSINLLSAVLEDTSDHGPVGGQLRVIGGTLTNKGSVYLKRGLINTYGGLADIIDGSFINDALVIVDGFFLRVSSGSFINNTGAVVINNTTILAEGEGEFTNNGTLSGVPIEE